MKNIPVIETGLSKDSDLFRMITTYWQLVKRNINGKDGFRHRDYWADLMEDTEKFRRQFPKYREFADDLIDAFIQEVLRREEKEIEEAR